MSVDAEQAFDSRLRAIRQAFRLEYVSIAWVSVEAGVALGAGIAAGSITLMAFGIDSVIELGSALVLIWRLRVELVSGRRFAESAERRARRVAGALLFMLAAYVIGSAGWSLWTRHGESFSWPGLAVAAASLPVMWVLSRGKLKLAAELGSGALRADAMESITCGWLSLVVVVGLVAQLFIGAWWVDPVTSLAILYFLIKEGWEAWSGEDCCD